MSRPSRLLTFARRLPRRTAVAALALVMLQVGAAGSYFFFVCSMDGGGARMAACCCPLVAAAPQESDPSDPSMQRASCCDPRAMRLGTAPGDEARVSAGVDALAPVLVVTAAVSAPRLMVVSRRVFAAERQGRGPPILLLKQSLLL